MSDIKSVGPVITDDNFDRFMGGAGSRGYVDFFEPGLGASDYNLRQFEDSGIVETDESDWDDAIREQERDRSTIQDLCNEFNSPVKWQKSTNYCWIFGCIRCLEIVRLRETAQVYSLSPASCGARIKNFWNQGGYAAEGLRGLQEMGCNLSEDWPDAAISRRYLTDENIESAKRNIVLEAAHVRTWKQLGSSVIAGYPVAVGYNWWRHLVAGTRIFLKSHDLGIDNSWGTQWGDNGRGTLSGRRKHPDGAIVIYAAKPI